MGLYGNNEQFLAFSGQKIQKYFWREKSTLKIIIRLQFYHQINCKTYTVDNKLTKYLYSLSSHRNPRNFSFIVQMARLLGLIKWWVELKMAEFRPRQMLLHGDKGGPPDDEPSCYTGRVVSFTLLSNNKVSVPICKTITSFKTACVSSMADNNNQRKCVPSRTITMEGVSFNTACSCVPKNI